MKKKLLALLLGATVACMGFAGCGEEEEKSPFDDAKESRETKETKEESKEESKEETKEETVETETVVEATVDYSVDDLEAVMNSVDGSFGDFAFFDVNMNIVEVAQYSDGGMKITTVRGDENEYYTVYVDPTGAYFFETPDYEVYYLTAESASNGDVTQSVAEQWAESLGNITTVTERITVMNDGSLDDLSDDDLVFTEGTDGTIDFECESDSLYLAGTVSGSSLLSMSVMQADGCGFYADFSDIAYYPTMDDAVGSVTDSILLEMIEDYDYISENFGL